MSAQVTTTISAYYDHLDAAAVINFAAVLEGQSVHPSAPVQVKQHHGQRDQDEGVTMTCLIVHGPS